MAEHPVKRKDGDHVREPEAKRAKKEAVEANAGPRTVETLLKETTLLKFQKERRYLQKNPTVVTLEHNQTAGDALRTLAANNILSAPVLLAASADDKESGTFLGVVDVSSLLFHLVRDYLLPARASLPKVLNDTSEICTAELVTMCDTLKHIGEEFCSQMLITVTGNDSGAAYRGEEHESLWDLVRFGFLGMTPGSSVQNPMRNVHRVTIFNPNGQVAGIISQSDLARFIFRNNKCADNLKRKTVAEEGLLKPVETVKDCVTALDTLITMFEHEGISAVGIVDSDGRLVGNFSASDVRGLVPSEFACLCVPVLSFVALRHSQFHSYAKPPKVQTADDTSTLYEILEIIVKFKTHRVYIVDEDERPVGVVTITDILRVIVRENDA